MVAFSQASRDIRTRLLSMPAVWVHVTSIFTNRTMRNLQSHTLADLLQRSADLDLTLGFDISELVVPRCLPALTTNSRRISDLRMRISRNDTRVPWKGFWSAMQQALLVPMPRLTVLFLTVIDSRSVSDTGVGRRIGCRSHLPIAAITLAQWGPQLRSCLLWGPQLHHEPHVEFAHMTCFQYAWSGRVFLADLAPILSLMPHLRTLGITVSTLDATPRPTHDDDVAAWATLCPSLERLQLRTDAIARPSRLCLLFPLQRLRQFDIGRTQYPLRVVSALHRTSDVTRLVASRSELTLISEDSGGRPARCIWFRGVDSWLYQTALFCAKTLTSLAIQERVWPTEHTQGGPPALPAVTTLCIGLAACGEYGGLSFTVVSVAWPLPALRRLQISTPSKCGGRVSNPLCCHREPMSISLHDVAQFVRTCLKVDGAARLLTSVRLAGFRVVDLDFCEAWRQMQTFARKVELVEKPDIFKHMYASDPAGADLEATFASKE